MVDMDDKQKDDNRNMGSLSASSDKKPSHAGQSSNSHKDSVAGSHSNPPKEDEGTEEDEGYVTGLKLAVIFTSLCVCEFLVALDTTMFVKSPKSLSKPWANTHNPF